MITSSIKDFRMDDIISIMQDSIDSGGEFRFMPRGTSMLPLLREGKDSVAIVKITEKIKKHDILLYRRKNGQYVLHRVVGIDKNDYIMCGDNQISLEHGITDEQLIGKITAVLRDQKRIELTSFKYRLYSAIWCFMPLRKAIFFLRRAVGKIKRTINKQNCD